MATITAGTSATFTSPIAERQLFDAIHYWQNAERNSTEEERFTSNKDDTFRLTGTFKLPGKLTFNPTTGLFAVTAEPYLPTTTFSAGSPVGTIKGATFAQYFVDLCQYIILWQMTTGKNPNSQYNLNMTYNYSAATFNGEFNIPYTTAIQPGGGVLETATEWLTT